MPEHPGEGRGRRARATGVPRQLVGDVAAGIRRDSGEEVVERAAERVDVALNAGRPAVPRLLGCHVVDGADRRSLAGDALVLEFGLEGQPQVDDLDLARRRAQDVGWLDVAMDQAAGRRVTQAAGDAP